MNSIVIRHRVVGLIFRGIVIFWGFNGRKPIIHISVDSDESSLKALRYARQGNKEYGGIERLI
jgi:hypothetical protein